METIKVKFEKFENTDKDFVRQYADTIEAEEARKKLGFDGFVVMAAFSEYIEVVFYKKEKKQ